MTTKQSDINEAVSRSVDNVLLVSPVQLADMLSISKREVERMVSSHRLPKPIRLGKRLVRWRMETIRRWLAELEEQTHDDG